MLSPIKRPKQAPSFNTGMNVPDGTAMDDAITEKKNLSQMIIEVFWHKVDLLYK